MNDTLAAGDLHVVDPHEIATQRVDRFDQVGQVTGLDPVVAVQESDQPALCHSQAGVAGVGQAQRGVVPDDPHTRQGRAEVVDDLGRAVARAIVDDHELEIMASVAL